MLVFTLLQLIVFGEKEALAIRTYKSSLPLEDTINQSGLHYLNRDQDKKELSSQSLTVCVRFNYARFIDYASVFEIKNPNSAVPFLAMRTANYPGAFSWFGEKNSMSGKKNTFRSALLVDPELGHGKIWKTNNWHHLCFAYSHSDSWVTMIKDGTILFHQFDKRVENVQLLPNMMNDVYVGRTSEQLLHRSSHSGFVTDFNMWNRALRLEELKDWTICRSDLKGDLLNWETSEWNVINMDVIELPMDDICKPKDLGFVAFPEKVNFTSAITLCNSMSGGLVKVNSVKEEKDIYNLLSPFSHCINETWIDLWDATEEGVFQSAQNSSNKLTDKSYQNWINGEPNGNVFENCITTKYFRNDMGWNDLSCGNKKCTVCRLGPSPFFDLRGLCFGSQFEPSFGWTGQLSDNFYTFRGFSKSFMSWNATRNEWQITLYGDPNVLATCNETRGEYPLGTRNWFFFNDTCKFSESTGVSMYPLSFSACTENEFACNDGSCIDLVSRCNGQPDCRDKSDEIDCNKIRFHPSYVRNEPPLVKNNSDFLTTIDVEIVIESILDINEVNSNVQMQLQVQLQWNDSRLEYIHLKEGRNAISFEQKLNLWMPKLMFLNTKEITPLNLDETDSFANIFNPPGIKGKRAPWTSLKNEEIFQGKDCPLIFSKKILVDFLCEFNMKSYPFDFQTCEAKIGINELEGLADLFHLRLSSAKYAGAEDLMQYMLLNVTSYSNGHEVVVQLSLGRRILNVLSTAFLPTTLIIVVSFSTNLYKLERFDAIATVNLTCLLVMVTFFIGISATLPNTSYMKMIDIWMIFCIFIPFMEVILHAVINHWSKDETTNVVEFRAKFEDRESTKTDKLLKTTTYGLPMLAMLFTIIYFIIGFLLLFRVI